MNEKETKLFEGVIHLLDRMVDGINGYEVEGHEISKYWKPEEVERARWFLHNIEHIKGSKHSHS